jgi:hypothetical protein
MATPVIGIIGGSGLYEIDGLADVAWRRVASPFGETSDEFCFGTGSTASAVVFLPRHGRGHPLPPSAINFRANIDALKRCGVTDIVSLSAVGSLREDLAPGISSSSTSSSTAPSRAKRASSGPAASRMSRWRTRSAAASATRWRRRAASAAAGEARRHLPRHGGAAILDAGRERTLPQLGLQRDRHDQHARGQARPRGRDLLRDRRDGDRLRLLAPRTTMLSPSTWWSRSATLALGPRRRRRPEVLNRFRRCESAMNVNGRPMRTIWLAEMWCPIRQAGRRDHRPDAAAARIRRRCALRRSTTRRARSATCRCAARR